MKLTYSLSKAELIVFDRVIPATCKVRKRERNQVVRTIPSERPYMPKPFPVGIWEVGRPVERHDDYKRPYFIPTTAWQEVKVWEVEQGRYVAETDETVKDYGYGLHYSLSTTTLGCIRIMSLEDLLWLVQNITKAIYAQEKITLEVTE